MTTTTIPTTTPVEPDGAPRIAVLDILRGIAILGILFMNINDMGQALTASMGDFRHLGWSAIDQVAWWIRAIVADGTARCLLEMLFGAGMVILTDRFATAAQGRWSVLKRYWWRNIVLYVFGLIHMFVLLWPGDILHTYAIAALVAVLFRRLRPRWLITIGLIGAMLQLVGGTGFGYIMGTRQLAEVARVEARRDAGQPLTKPDAKILADAKKRADKRAKNEATERRDIAREDAARSGTPTTWVREQVKQSVDWLVKGNEIFALIESLTVMLIGAGLFKLGVLQGSRTRRYYIGLLLIGYGVGIASRTLFSYEMTRFDDLPHVSWGLYEIGRLAMTLGHVAAVNLLVTTIAGARLLKPFVAAGQTALSIYIAQTIVTLWVLFPPWGFGLYRTLSWAPLMAAALAINLVLLWLANVYVRHYRIAPVEWAWRSIVEWRRLPFRKALA